MPTLTVANSSFTLSLPDVFPVPQPIEGYSADDAFDTENVAPSEAVMGVDANLSAGYTPYPVKLKFVLQGDSPSNEVMDTWRQTMDQQRETFFANATIVAPGLGKVFTFTKGSLTGDMPMPQGKKIFQPQTYEITFQNITAAPV